MFKRVKKKDQLSSAPILPMKHLKNCKLIPQRFNLLDKLKKQGVGAEIGVLGGDWSERLIRFTNPEKIALIDTFYSNDYKKPYRFTKHTHLQYIKEKFKNSTSVVDIKQGLSWNCMADYPKNHFDWVYIDAAHNYDSVIKDLEQAHRILKLDGSIIMNDYIMYDHIAKDDYGVVQATNEFLIKHNFEMLYFALHPKMFCDVLIRKIID